MWEEVFEPACAELGLKPIRADRIASAGEITEQIFGYLRDADVVIADLSGANPNVMYELGLRHTRNKLTVQIGEHARLPFDVNTIRTIQFKRTEAGLIEARDSLIETLRHGLAGNSSPVAATRVWNDSSEGRDDIERAIELSKAPDSMELEVEQLGILDILAEGEAAVHDIGSTLNDVTGVLDQLNGMTANATSELHVSDARGKGFAGRLIVTRKLAGDLAEPVNVFEALAQDFLLCVDKVDAMMGIVLDRFEEDPAERDQASVFIKDTLELTDVSAETAVSLSGFIKGAIGFRKYAKDLAPVSKTMERSVNRYLLAIDRITSWRPRLQALVEH